MRFPRPVGTDDPQAILINTAGGLTGGVGFGEIVEFIERNGGHGAAGPAAG